MFLRYFFDVFFSDTRRHHELKMSDLTPESKITPKQAKSYFKSILISAKFGLETSILERDFKKAYQTLTQIEIKRCPYFGYKTLHEALLYHPEFNDEDGFVYKSNDIDGVKRWVNKKTSKDAHIAELQGKPSVHPKYDDPRTRTPNMVDMQRDGNLAPFIIGRIKEYIRNVPFQKVSIPNLEKACDHMNFKFNVGDFPSLEVCLKHINEFLIKDGYVYNLIEFTEEEKEYFEREKIIFQENHDVQLLEYPRSSWNFNRPDSFHQIPFTFKITNFQDPHNFSILPQISEYYLKDQLRNYQTDLDTCFSWFINGLKNILIDKPLFSAEDNDKAQMCIMLAKLTYDRIAPVIRFKSILKTVKFIVVSNIDRQKKNYELIENLSDEFDTVGETTILPNKGLDDSSKSYVKKYIIDSNASKTSNTRGEFNFSMSDSAIENSLFFNHNNRKRCKLFILEKSRLKMTKIVLMINYIDFDTFQKVVIDTENPNFYQEMPYLSLLESKSVIVFIGVSTRILRIF